MRIRTIFMAILLALFVAACSEASDQQVTFDSGTLPSSPQSSVPTSEQQVTVDLGTLPSSPQSSVPPSDQPTETQPSSPPEPRPVESQPVGTEPPVSTEPTASSASDSLVPTDIFSGTLSFTDDDVPVSVEFDRVFSQPRWPREVTAGDFVFELRDASGNAVRSIPFQVSRPHVDCFDGGCDQFPPTGYFIFLLSDPPKYASFAVMWEGKEIGSMERSPNAPVLSIDGPPAGRAFSLDDTVDVSWEASDPDGDELFFRVYYSTDGGETYSLLRLETQETSLSATGRQLYGTEQARFAVAVTDGTKGDFIESEIFSVQGQPPEITLESPYSGVVIAGRRGFLMKASAFDPDENTGLPSEAFSWESDIDGHIDVGSFLVLSASDFTPGKHTVTVTATDRTGMSSSLSFEMNITLVNEIPVANDDAATVTQGETIRIDVLANDIDLERDMDMDRFIILDWPTLGSAKAGWTDDYSFFGIEYTGVNAGVDTFTYQICDWAIDRCDDATVTVTVTAEARP